MPLSKQDEALFDACEKGDLEAARRALQNGAYIQAKNSGTGSTALHRSLNYGHVNIAFFLIENNADVNAKNDHGSTPLHRAARQGLDIVGSLLLEKGADPSITNKGGETPLHYARGSNNQKCVDILELVAGKSEQQRKRLMKERRENERLLEEKHKQERLLQEQQQKLEQFKEKCLEKFATRTALDQELERLEKLIEEAQLSLDPNMNAAAAKIQEEYDGYLPCREFPEYTEVPILEAILRDKKQAAIVMKFGPERSKAVQEIDELEKRLQREYESGAKKTAAVQAEYLTLAIFPVIIVLLMQCSEVKIGKKFGMIAGIIVLALFLFFWSRYQKSLDGAKRHITHTVFAVSCFLLILWEWVSWWFMAKFLAGMYETVAGGKQTLQVVKKARQNWELMTPRGLLIAACMLIVCMIWIWVSGSIVLSLFTPSEYLFTSVLAKCVPVVANNPVALHVIPILLSRICRWVMNALANAFTSCIQQVQVKNLEVRLKNLEELLPTTPDHRPVKSQ